MNKVFAFIGLLASITLIALLLLGLTNNPAYANSTNLTGHYQFQAVYRAKSNDIVILRLDTITGKIERINFTFWRDILS